MTRAIGTAGAQRRLGAVDRLGQLLGGERRARTRAWRRRAPRPVRGAGSCRWISRRTSGAPSSALTIRSRSRSDADSPISRPFISMASTMAMTTSSTPMAIEPTASQRGSSVKWARSTPVRAKNRPISAPMSSSRTTGSSGCLERCSHRHHDVSAPLHVAGLPVRRAQRERLEDDGDDEDADGDAEVVDLVRVADLLDALVEGEQAAHREQHEGDDEGPEVALAAVAERVLAVGGLARPLAAEQQQRLVAGVGERVDGLGEQARRRRDQEADELGDGDAEVGEEARTGRLCGCLRSRAQVATRRRLAASGPRHPAGAPVAWAS